MNGRDDMSEKHEGMTGQPDERMIELAELYALGGLEPDEEAQVEAYLAGEGCREAVARGRFAAFALAKSVSQEPPPRLRERVLAIATPRPASGRQTQLPARPRFWMQPAWLAAAAAVVVIVFAAAWFHNRWLSPASWTVACAPVAAPCAVTGRVVATADHLRFEAHGLQAPPAGKVYEAWYIRQGAKPAPAPTFAPDANGDASVDLPVAWEKGLTVAITVEPAGGSKSPTTKPFLVSSIN